MGQKSEGFMRDKAESRTIIESSDTSDTSRYTSAYKRVRTINIYNNNIRKCVTVSLEAVRA